MEEPVSWTWAVGFAVTLGAMLIGGAWSIANYVLARLREVAAAAATERASIRAEIDLRLREHAAELKEAREGASAAVAASEVRAGALFASRESVARVETRLDAMAAGIADIQRMLHDLLGRVGGA